MSRKSGDRARFDRERKKKVLRRQRTREFLKRADGGTNPRREAPQGSGR